MAASIAEDRSVPKNWSVDDIPSLTGKTVVITGGNSGIGFEAALAMVRRGATVILACRNADKAEDAAKRILEAVATTDGHGTVATMALDVSSLESVRTFAAEFRAAHSELNILINNAGVMAVPFSLSVDGHERQFATNHLGHFALTAQLLDLLKAGAPSRVISVSSHAHRDGRVVPTNRIMIADEKNYNSATMYGQSKLYNLLFAKELGRRLEAQGVTGVRSIACHPGLTRTNLTDSPSTENGFFMRAIWKVMTATPVWQDPATGALPTLYAATVDNVRSGDYYGPSGFLSLWGAPTREEPSSTANSEDFARAVWEESERLANIRFDVK